MTFYNTEYSFAVKMSFCDTKMVLSGTELHFFLEIIGPPLEKVRIGPTPHRVNAHHSICRTKILC